MRGLSLLALLVACSEVPATNPFDPSAPASAQVPGEVVGSVVLPEGFDAERLDEARVVLRDARDPSEVAFESVIEDSGAFTLAEVTPGSYALRASVPGFAADELQLLVEVDGRIELDPLELRPRRDAAFTGTVLRLGAEAHGGVLVEAVGTPYATFTTAEGLFRLEVGGGDHTLRFTASGYAALDRSEAEVGETETRALGQIGIAAEPGALSGTVSLAGDLGLGEAGLRAVELSLLDEEGEGETLNPDGEGRFFFAGLGAGIWRLRALRDGFVERNQELVIGAGETVHLPTLSLEPVALQVRLQGRVELERQSSHAGTRVELEGSALSASTDALGDFTLLAPARRETYRLRVSRTGYNAEGAQAEAPSAEAIEAALAADEDIPLPVDPEVVVLSGQPGSVAARVEVAAGDAELLGRVSAELFSLADLQTPVALRNPDAEGRVLFEDVVAGQYELRVSLAGFGAVTRFAELAPGEAVSVDPIRLSADLDQARAFIVGTALRGCEGCEHGGIIVEAEGFDFVAITGREGQYRLEVVAGPSYDLVFSAPGYEAEVREGIVALAGADTPGPEVTLDAARGVLRAQVRLARLQTSERLGEVDLGLYADPAGAEPLRTAEPDGEGAVLIAEVVPGRYRLRASAEGYRTEERLVVVDPGAEALAGVFDLPHLSDTEEAVPLRGRILLGDRQDHAGSRISVRVDPDNLLLATVDTDAAGDFVVPAASDERYRVSVQRAGYLGPVEFGPLRWNGEAFVDEDGEGVEHTLGRTPIDGRITVLLDVGPAWLPVRERFARVVLTGPVNRTEEPVFGGGEGLSFVGLPEGTYTLRVERAGFVADAVAPIRLTQAETSVDLGPVMVQLSDLSEARLDLRGHAVDACDLQGFVVAGADLSGAVLTGDYGAPDCPDAERVDLSDADLSGADLTGAVMAGVSLVAAELEGTDLRGVDLRGVDAAGADFFGADLRLARLDGATLDDANFTSARLAGALLVDGPRDAGGAVQPSADGAWPELGAPETPWVDAPCAGGGPALSLRRASFARADLRGAFMPGLDLSGVADLSGAVLADADLRFTCLRHLDLGLLDLSGATFDGADAVGAQFTGTLLRRTSLRGARLSGASLINAVLDDTDLRRLPEGCEALRDWADYDEGGVCAEAPSTADCNCRTRMDEAVLDGANLVGAVLEGVDLAGATMLGVTIGNAERLGITQPPACQPEAFLICSQLAELMLACGPLNPGSPTGDLEARLELCSANPSDPSTLGDVGLELGSCIVRRWLETNECAFFEGCVGDGGQEDVIGPTLEHDCTWAALSAGVEGACDLNGGTHVHDACLLAPTVIDGARLDDAQLTGVVLNEIELRDTRLRRAVLRNSVFVGNALRGVDFTDADFSDASLNDLDLTGQEVTGASFEGARLRGATFDGAEISGADFTAADLREASFDYVLQDAAGAPASLSGADLSGASVQNFAWAGVDLTDAILRRAVISAGSLEGADLSGAVLQATQIQADLSDGRLSGARIIGGTITQNLSGAEMRFTQFSGTDLGSDLTDLRAFRSDWERVRFFNHTDFAGSDLAAARFGSSDISGVGFAETSLQGAEFSDSDASNARFTGACLRSATFRDTELRGANLVYAGLREVDLSDADLSNANLCGVCNVRTADLDGVLLEGATVCESQRVDFELHDFIGTPQYIDCSGGCPAADSVPGVDACPGGC